METIFDKDGLIKNYKIYFKGQRGKSRNCQDLSTLCQRLIGKDSEDLSFIQHQNYIQK